ncbi:hypothetical protein B1748_18650 [Paenibacillus sp. MY03]|uniref:DUF488 family protein, N3 subclade n=1 Tax=Paenibacillus sp. MY03 TaxID=302980 RepID=UPI000B3C8CF5|nr:DUF488 family protein [Paenibacillus sp. MY03]OUS75157.1 hypothetical protein B1748_18650 [Paenibacillus sp. MY03]
MNNKYLNPSGKLYTCNASGLHKVNFEADRLLITRAGNEIRDTETVRDLSPSPDLFRTALQEWKNKLDEEEWWPLYEKRFLKELEWETRVKALREVYKRLIAGKNVVLICFCPDHRYCHRKLVGEFFNKYGVEVQELNPIKVEQIKLF